MMSSNLTDWMIQLAEAGVRLRYPIISAREAFLRAAALRIPQDLMIKATVGIRTRMSSIRDDSVQFRPGLFPLPPPLRQ